MPLRQPTTSLKKNQHPITQFFKSDAAGGVVLIVAAIAAMVVANSPMMALYTRSLQNVWLGLSFEHWINDGLMALFFLMAGLEIKRELLAGSLATWFQRALPGSPAIGGMLVSSLIYVGVNWGNSETLAGWAIPAATDIAFALGVLSLLGSRVPVSYSSESCAGSAHRKTSWHRRTILSCDSGRSRTTSGALQLVAAMGVSIFCGIGFTMSLFIGSLAFSGNTAVVDEVKVGVPVGSLLSALIGAAALVAANRKSVIAAPE